MTSLAIRLVDWLVPDEAGVRAAPYRPRASEPPLIGDIVAARAGVPEHLIQWRRAEGSADPDPQNF